jgi:hypothetical protein
MSGRMRSQTPKTSSNIFAQRGLTVATRTKIDIEIPNKKV